MTNASVWLERKLFKVCFLVIAISVFGVGLPYAPVLAQGHDHADVRNTRSPRAAEVVLEGELEVLHEHREKGSQYEYFLRTGKERLKLHFDQESPPLQSGQRVRVRGRRSKNVLSLGATAAASLQTLSSPILPDTFGAQKTLVIMINFPDSAAPDYTIADVQPVIDATNNYYLANSYGQTWFDADIVGSYTIAQSSAGCDYGTIASLADQAAMTHGVNVSAYRRLVYLFPRNGCSSGGRGMVGGNPSRAWIQDSLIPHIWMHELGHNLGLFHSHWKICDSCACSINEYGDTDVMGSDTSAHFNPFQKERLGWLNYDDGVHVMPEITTITTDGVYTLGTYESQNTDPKALKILKSTNPDNGKNAYYYFHYLQPLWENVQFGYALLHSGSEEDGNSSFLLDTKPLTSGGQFAFNVGDTYADAAGTTITLLSENRSGITLAIQLPPPCSASPPTVSLSPSQGQTVLPGTSLSYQVTVTNNFGASCGASDVFHLSSPAPSGWTSSLQDETLTIPPGESRSTELQITVSPAATAGTSYVWVVSASNRELQDPARTNVSMTIASCTRFNPTIALSPSGAMGILAGSSALFSVSITNNNSAVCSPTVFNLNTQAPFGWTASAADNSLTIAPGVSASTTVLLQAPAKLRGGSYMFSITATDASNSRYASSADGTLICCSKLTIAARPDKKTYAANEPVAVTINVHSSKSVVPGANVSVSILQGGIVTASADAVTNENGVASVQFTSGVPGKYQVATTVSLNGASGNGKASFSVK